MRFLKKKKLDRVVYNDIGNGAGEFDFVEDFGGENYYPLGKSKTTSRGFQIDIWIDSPIGVAGKDIHGRLEINVNNKNLKLGDIIIELAGYEESYYPEEKRYCFLFSQHYFQGRNLSPSSAVIGNGIGGFWNAVTAKTVFPFVFKLPKDTPSSLQFSNGALRYVITGVVDVMKREKVTPFTKSIEVPVVEWINGKDLQEPRKVHLDIPIQSKENGLVSLTGIVEQPLVIAGTNVIAEILVRNESSKTISNLCAQVKNRCRVPYYSENASDIHKRKTEEKSSPKQTLNGSFDPGEQRSMLISLPVPRDFISIQNTGIVESSCSVFITLSPNGSPIGLDLPIYVVKEASLRPPPPPRVESFRHPRHYNRMILLEKEKMEPVNHEGIPFRPHQTPFLKTAFTQGYNSTKVPDRYVSRVDSLECILPRNYQTSEQRTRFFASTLEFIQGNENNEDMFDQDPHFQGENRREDIDESAFSEQHPTTLQDDFQPNDANFWAGQDPIQAVDYRALTGIDHLTPLFNVPQPPAQHLPLKNIGDETFNPFSSLDSDSNPFNQPPPKTERVETRQGMNIQHPKHLRDLEEEDFNYNRNPGKDYRKARY